MKTIILLSLLALTSINCNNLKKQVPLPLINEHNAKAGSFDNIAPGAKDIINPEIADAKLAVHTHRVVPQIVVRRDFIHENVPVASRHLNRVSGKWEDHMEARRVPIAVDTPEARLVNVSHHTLTNLKTGEEINTHRVNEPKTTFGVDPTKK